MTATMVKRAKGETKEIRETKETKGAAGSDATVTRLAIINALKAATENKNDGIYPYTARDGNTYIGINATYIKSGGIDAIWITSGTLDASKVTVAGGAVSLDSKHILFQNIEKKGASIEIKETGIYLNPSGNYGDIYQGRLIGMSGSDSLGRTTSGIAMVNDPPT